MSRKVFTFTAHFKKKAMEEQKLLFDIIKTRITKQHRLVDVLEELLKMSGDSVYRRIRGETELSFSELMALCKAYDISMDEVFNYKSRQSAIFHYTPVNFSDQESYVAYIKRMSESFIGYYNAPSDFHLKKV